MQPLVRYGRGSVCCAIISLFILPAIYGACRLINLLIVAVPLFVQLLLDPIESFFFVGNDLRRTQIGTLESSLMN